MLNTGITLRGAGPGSTIIQRTNGCKALSPSSNGNCGNNPTPFIIVGPEQYNDWVTSTNLTADAAQGASSVQSLAPPGLRWGKRSSSTSCPTRVGSLTWAWGEAVKIWAASDYRVTWQKHNPSQGFDDFSSSQYPYQNNTAGCWFSTPAGPSGTNQRCDRTTSEIKKISAISGTTITFDSPITISYRVANTAQLSYYQNGVHGERGR